MKHFQRSPLLLWALFFAAMFCLPSVLKYSGIDGGGRYALGVLNDIGLYAILALSLNIILGNCGLFNMGHAAFFAIGAYTTAILNTVGLPVLGLENGVPVLWTLPLSGLAAGLFAFVVARPIIHLRGDYLLVVTIGIMEIIRITVVNDIFGLTGGNSGIYGIARPEIAGYKLATPAQLYYLIWGFALITIILFSLLARSRFGRALNYIKQDELAAAGSGINVASYKIMAFTVGAFWAGMAGTLYSAKMRTIAPEGFTFSESVLLFAIVILGGAGSIPGVLLGAFLLIGLPEVFREFSSARLLFFGAAMVAMMIFRPQGLLPPRPRDYKADSLIGKYPSGMNKSADAAAPSENAS